MDRKNFHLKGLCKAKYGSIAIALLAIAAALIGKLFSGEDKEIQTPAPIAVTTVSVTVMDSLPRLQLTGSVEGATSSIIASRFDGRVEKVFVENGQTVSSGQALVTLDTLEMTNGVRVAENNLRQQEAHLAQAQSDYHRYSTLYASNAVSRQTLEAHQTNQVAAQSALDNARAELENARKKITDSTITAPFSGLVANKAVTQGQYISSGATLMTIESLDTVYVTVNVGQKDIARVPIGTEATISVDTYPGQQFKGQVAILNPVAGQENRMFQVKIRVDNPQHKLMPGMFAQAVLQTSTPVRAIFVPREAVQTEKGLSYVFIHTNHKARKVSVELGVLMDDRMEITRGLTEGQEVIIDNLDTVKDGDEVNATPSGGESSAPGASQTKTETDSGSAQTR